MTATEKMQAIGMKALLARVQEIRPATAIETLYRWKQAIDDGRGIKDANKRLLIAASAGTDFPIEPADFFGVSPQAVEAAQ